MISAGFGLSACNKSKEQDMKKMMGISQTAGKEDPLTLAEKNPTFENLTAAGLSLSQAKQPDKAVVYFARALAQSPKSALALNNLCAENNNLGKWDISIGFCEQAIAITPTFQLAKNNLKFAQDSKAAQLKLISSLQTKIEATKGKARHVHLVDLGFEYYKMGDYDQAVLTWGKVKKSDENLYVRTLNNLGSAYIIMKKFDLAKSSLEEATKLDPKNQLVKNNLAWLKTASEAAASTVQK
jgi:tetratricopeptide (TPR) repeat protein